jgi:tetratricopeptide (TPR) repeat protein
MKADHRHQLKTNELADWLAHLPEWARQNRTNLVAVAAVLVVAVIVYFWGFYRRDVVSVRNQVRLTTLLTQVPQQVDSVMRAAMQNTDQSYTLQLTAQDLQEFAQDLSDNNMAALALIKRAETLRTELHLRLAEVSRDELAKQIGQARASYQQALDRKPSSPALAATAHFGLGLCEEELGNFEQAAEIYRTAAGEQEYAGTVAQAAADHRLKIMDDFRTQIVFQPAPQPPLDPSSMIQVVPGDEDEPAVIRIPQQPSVAPVGPVLGPEEGPQEAPADETPPPAAETTEPTDP